MDFFSTVGRRGIGARDEKKDNEEEGAMPGDSTGISIMASGPTFVKSQQTTLLSEEHDIRASRQKTAKVTFAKPKPKAAPAKEVKKDDNFVRAGSKNDIKQKEKLAKLEDDVNQLYGSKAYQMLQKMSTQKNKRDAVLNDGEEVEDQQSKKAYSLGEGLGKHGQGIINPVEAALMPAQGGIGSEGKGKRDKRNKRDDADSDLKGVANEIDMDIYDKAGEKKKEEEAEAQKKKLDAEDKAFLNLFQRNRRERRQNFRQQYDEMQQKFKTEHGGDEPAPAQASNLQDTMKRLNIIDMTGSAVQIQVEAQKEPQVRGLPNGRNLLLKKVMKAKDEAKFNVKALVVREEYQENLKVELERELANINQQTAGRQIVLQEMKDFQAELKQVSDQDYEETQLQSKLRDLATRFHTLYQQHEVSYTFAAKILKTQLVPMNFTGQALTNFDTFLAVRNILTIGCSPDDQDSKDRNIAFLAVAFETYWLAPFRQFFGGKLEISSEAGLVVKHALNEWMALMPNPFIKKVVDQIVMPKLQVAIKSWNPRDTKRGLETWLTPWCDVIGKKNMKVLFDSVKQQITPVFGDKKLFKKNGIRLMKPWVKVLERSEVQIFANRYVYPRLIAAVKKLEVDPADQRLSALTQLFEWTRLLPASFSEKQAQCILSDYFLPKLLQTLQQWLEVILEGDDEAYSEIMVWYKGWKNFLLEQNKDVVDVDKVSEVFYLMMLMIDRKLGGD